jgi:UDPglucose 6-dehydrogenase
MKYNHLMNVSVIGLGKLGLPFAVLLGNAGYKVFAYDLSKPLVDALNSGRYTTKEPELMDYLAKAGKNIKFCNDISDATKTTEAIFIIVPTPSLENGYFSNNEVIKVIESFKPEDFMQRKIVINIVSTVMPGSSVGVIKSAIEKTLGQKVGDSIGLCYNPEFIALGSVIKNMQQPDMHLLGQDSSWAGDIIEEIINSIVVKSVPCRRMNLTEAELVKIAINNFVTMKISYANNLYQAAVNLGEVDIDLVTEAIGLDTRIGQKYLKGSAPYGGPCFPRDTRALSALYKSLGVPIELSRATEIINNDHVSFISGLIKNSLGSSKKIGLIGLSYKEGTPVIEESPGVAIVKNLLESKLEVSVWDDEIIELPEDLSEKVKYKDNFRSLISECDFVVISRPFSNIKEIYSILKEVKKPYFDLWRQLP